MAKSIFLSHIHEESALAVLIKKAIEDEFGGFVEVFVSSDGTSIRAGSHFIDKIEEGLVNCVGAVYLVSPNSIKRPWISFELGAVWVRNAISKRSGGTTIPAIPFCHSGQSLGGLPPPISSLNAIEASDARSLARAFEAVQFAVGGRGNLKTDFEKLAAEILALEDQYTVGTKLHDIFLQLKSTAEQVSGLMEAANSSSDEDMPLQCGWQSNEFIDRLENLERGALKGKISVKVENRGVSLSEKGAINGGYVTFKIDRELLLKQQKQIESAVRRD